MEEEEAGCMGVGRGWRLDLGTVLTRQDGHGGWRSDVLIRDR